MNPCELCVRNKDTGKIKWVEIFRIDNLLIIPTCSLIMESRSWREHSEKEMLVVARRKVHKYLGTTIYFITGKVHANIKYDFMKKTISESTKIIVRTTQKYTSSRFYI